MPSQEHGFGYFLEWCGYYLDGFQVLSVVYVWRDHVTTGSRHTYITLSRAWAGWPNDRIMWLSGILDYSAGGLVQVYKVTTSVHSHKSVPWCKTPTASILTHTPSHPHSHTRSQTHVHRHTLTQNHTHSHPDTLTDTHTPSHTHSHTCSHTHAHTRMLTHTRSHTRSHTHTQTHSHTHTHTHSLAHILAGELKWGLTLLVWASTLADLWWPWPITGFKLLCP